MKDLLQDHPEMAIFLTLGLGFLIGRLHYKTIALGSVTGTLLAGVLVGQADVEIPDLVKTVAFVAFLFALGFSVGPQFFAGLRSDGAPQLALAVISCVIGLAGAYAVAKALGYGPGWGAGLLAGGLTQSAVIGVAGSAIQALPDISAAQVKEYESQIAVGYAVCYLFGTAAAAYFLSVIAPRMVGTTDLAAEAHEMERALGVAKEPDVGKAYYSVVRRTYRVDNPAVAGRTVADLERMAREDGHRVLIDRVRHDGRIEDVTPATTLALGDTATVTSRRPDLVAAGVGRVGPETDDPELLGYAIETLPIVVTDKAVAGRTIGEVFDRFGPRVFVDRVVRAGIEVPWSDAMVIHHGDEIVVEGARDVVEQVATHLGNPSRTTDATDLAYVGFGIALGCLVGIPTVTLFGAQIGLTTSGGALIVGLLFGWLRARSPTFGTFPAGAQWLMNTGGLCLFVGIVGITAGPSFIDGVQQKGLGLLVGGLVVTLLPMVTCLYLGKYVFKFKTPILLGVIAGANTTTASIGAITDTARSQVPVLGYTVPYAAANTLLTIWGTLIVALLA